MMRAGLLLTVLTLVATTGGCALTSKASPIRPRYFSPELPPVAALATPSAASTTPIELRLGLVDAASYLEERISFRVNASELGYYEDRRWSERPEEYLRRALEQELFERRHVQRVLSGPGNTMDVELTSFDELRGSPGRVRVALRVTLHDERQSLLETTIVSEEPLLPDGAEDHAQRVASAMATALAAAVTRACDEVTNQLHRRPASAAPVAPQTGNEAPAARAG
ncbi:MAG TPA: ABC-type transport auxiliary lipoprotein family protein [Polyangiaceae bacterium]|nr:ABC-type transport auxiliary lipoprotein family protein [Polyangiaceae bacterium]